MDMAQTSEIIQERKYFFPLAISKNDLLNFKLTRKLSIFAYRKMVRVILIT